MPFLGNLPNASFQSRPTRQEFSVVSDTANSADTALSIMEIT
jgi:hypothetical protein